MPRNKRQIFFRINHLTPPRNLPLTVRSIGHYQFFSPALIDPPIKKWFSQLFWITEGGGDIFLGNKSHRVKKGDIFFHLPGERHDLRHIGEPWSYRWLTFDHPETPRLLNWFGLRERPVAAGLCPEHLFEAATRALRSGTPQGDRSAAHCAHAILLSIVAWNSVHHTSPSLASRCKQRMDDQFFDPLLSVESIADESGVHRSTLYRAFRREFSINPSRYLHDLRIRQAIWLLQETDLQIQEVARDSGFSDPNYFSRALREATGRPPHFFRLD